jgi:rSAM/selenodomain-associated transferase 2
MPVSVIIPVLNEASYLAQTIDLVRRQLPHEIIVVDGGSTDTSLASASGADLVLRTSPGRAVQMNAGAARARGDVVLFLHADCQLEHGALPHAEACLRRPGIIAGCFTMRVDASGILYRWIDFAAKVRVRLAGMIYGDQGLFLRRSLFEESGGFPPVRLMEDVYFSARLRGRGRMAIAPSRVLVSPRRWQRVGVVRQTARNWLLLGLAAAGVPPDRLAGSYPPLR